LADAGATISLLNAEIANALNLVIVKQTLKATGVTNDSLDMVGQTIVTVTLAPNRKHAHRFFVANNISHEVILGTDFLAKLGEVTYNFQDCTLKIGNGAKTTQLAMGEEAIEGVARVVHSITIPPLTEMAVVAQVNTATLQNQTCVFEGSQTLPYRLLVGKAVDTLDNRSFWVPIMNPTTNAIELPAKTIVGSVETLEEDIPLLSIPSKKEQENKPGNTGPYSDKLKKEKTRLDSEQFQTLKDLVDEFSDIIGENVTEMGETDLVEHVIETLPGTQPIRSKPYNIPVGIRAEIKEQIDQMVKNGLIQPSSGLLTSPLVLVKKKDGNWRFCVDYRKLNAVTVKESMPTSSIQGAIEVMHGKRYYSSIDLLAGYYQVTLQSREKSGFICPFGTYRFLKMPMGLSTAPSTFTRLGLALMADLISEGSSVVYLDDFLMTSSDWSSHVALLRTVFTRLRYAGLKYRLSKSQLCQMEVLFLGHILSQDGIAVAPHNTEKIKKFPQPKNVTEVRRMCGLFSYYRMFIKDFSKRIEPINRLTSKDTPFIWTQECEAVVNELKELLTSAPILVFPDFKVPFVLSTDASSVALGAVLEQRQEDGRLDRKSVV
jgi:hypothetical protein